MVRNLLTGSKALETRAATTSVPLDLTIEDSTPSLHTKSEYTQSSTERLVA